MPNIKRSSKYLQLICCMHLLAASLEISLQIPFIVPPSNKYSLMLNQSKLCFMFLMCMHVMQRIRETMPNSDLINQILSSNCVCNQFVKLEQKAVLIKQFAYHLSVCTSVELFGWCGFSKLCPSHFETSLPFVRSSISLVCCLSQHPWNHPICSISLSFYYINKVLRL